MCATRCELWLRAYTLLASVGVWTKEKLKTVVRFSIWDFKSVHIQVNLVYLEP